MKNAYFFLVYNILFLFFRFNSIAQNITYTNPVAVKGDAKTDMSVGISEFDNKIFIAWKETGTNARIHTGEVAKDNTITDEVIIDNAQSSFSPCLQAVNDKLFLLWIAPDGSVQYVVNKKNGFDAKRIQTLQLDDQRKFKLGLSTAAINNKLVIAGLTLARGYISCLVADATNDSLGIAAVTIARDEKMPDYPSVTVIDNNSVRILWKKSKNPLFDFADINIDSKKVTAPAEATNVITSPPVLIKHNNVTTYLWNSLGKNDYRLYYTCVKQNEASSNVTALPDFFSSSVKPSLCDADENHYLLAYAGSDQNIYISTITAYSGATWMRDFFHPAKEQYTLHDIVIPGSHDAGMSVLTGVGGQESNTINECNTLTQFQNIAGQLNSGLRMFDLRIGVQNNMLYMKHCASDCMEDAIGGGYGENFKEAMQSVHNFLHTNTKETIILTFSHFCERELPAQALADSVINYLGEDLIYKNYATKVGNIKLKDAAGKVIVVFEKFASKNVIIDSNTMQETSEAFFNMRRNYAATNELQSLLNAEETFFQSIKDETKPNDVVRLDWQLTQSSDEAAMICNDFESEKAGTFLNTTMFLTNIFRKHQSIIKLAHIGDKMLPVKVNEWIQTSVINNKSKPQILYVDAAGNWITDYCVYLNQTEDIYNKK